MLLCHSVAVQQYASASSTVTGCRRVEVTVIRTHAGVPVEYQVRSRRRVPPAGRVCCRVPPLIFRHHVTLMVDAHCKLCVCTNEDMILTRTLVDGFRLMLGLVVVRIYVHHFVLVSYAIAVTFVLLLYCIQQSLQVETPAPACRQPEGGSFLVVRPGCISLKH